MEQQSTESRLTFLRLTGNKTSDGHLKALYACSCGSTCELNRSRVSNGYTKSCGCISLELKTNLVHGMKGTPEYSSWTSMKDRCLNPASKDYGNWGGRGISIFPEWIDSFESFYNHLGAKPTNTTLDRIDNNKGYIPGNVRWASHADQMRNKRNSFVWHIKGIEFQTMYEAADYFGVTGHTVWRWVNGQFDNRRGSFSSPREDCYAIPRY